MAANQDHEKMNGTNHIHPPKVKGDDGYMIDIHAAYGVESDGNAGHSHRRQTPDHHFPFIVVGDYIPKVQFGAYWNSILNAPHEDIVVAELAGGANENDDSLPEGKADYSYSAMAAYFRNGNYPLGALDRLAVVIHLTSSLETRLARTARRGGDRDGKVTRIFCRDDYLEGFAQLLEQRGARLIEVDNEAERRPDEIQSEFQEIFRGLGLSEGSRFKGERGL